MRILFVATYDSSNSPLVNLIKAFQSQGHEIRVYALFNSDVNNKAFINNGIPFSNSELSLEELAQFDAVCLTQSCTYLYDIVGKIIKLGIFIFTLGTLFLSEVNPYVDVVFCLGENYISDLNEKFRHNCIAVGNPQFDTMLDVKPRINLKNLKRILFIEQGLYPVGPKGKRELAKLLVDIANRYKDYDICVKPRHLKHETYLQAHKCLDHLYYYFEDLGRNPDNLTLLNEHEELSYLISQSDCVITPWSTAYIEAGLMNKSILLIKGLPSENCMEVGEKRVNTAYQRLESTKCVINYKDVFNYLPDGLKMDESYLKKEVANYRNNCALKIVEIMEFINDKIIKNGGKLPLLPAMTYDNYQDIINNYIDNIEMDYRDEPMDLIQRELDKQTNQLIQTMLTIDRRLNYVFQQSDYSYFWEVANKIKQQIKFEDGYKKAIENFNNSLRETFDAFLNQFIVKNTDALMKNKISQAYMLEFYYMKKEYNCIVESSYEITSKEAFLFFFARVMFDNGSYQKALDCFNTYLEFEKSKQYRETFIDFDYYINFAKSLAFVSCLKLGKLEDYPYKISIEVQTTIFKLLYDLKEYEVLEHFPGEIIGKAAYWFFYGKTMHVLKKYKKAIESLNNYLLIQQEEEDRTPIIYNSTYQISAHFYLALSYYYLQMFDRAQTEFLICCKLTDGVHEKSEEFLLKCKEKLKGNNVQYA